MPAPDLRAELAVATEAAAAAASLLLARRGTRLRTGRKEHGELVTDADRAADHLIRSRLARAFAADAIYSEETPDDGSRLACERVWIVDPLDSTSSYVAGGDDFAVSVGLAVRGLPVAGAVAVPARSLLAAGAVGLGTTLNGRPARPRAPLDFARATVVVSRTETDVAEDIAPALCVPVSSLAHKLARVACGLDDAALSRKRRKEWGACAGAALVVAAGGRATQADGSPLRFNRSERRPLAGVAATSDDLHAALVAAARGAPSC